MKVVASTKLSRAQRAMVESRVYGETSNTVFDEAETAKGLKESSEGPKKELLVVCSSDKGLCGGIHSGMTRATRRMLAEKPDIEIVVLGEKCKAQIGRANGKNMVMSFAGVGKDIPTFADAQAIADQLVMLPTEYDSIQVMYNKFINAQSYEPVVVEAFSEEAIKASRMYRFEFRVMQQHANLFYQPTSPPLK